MLREKRGRGVIQQCLWEMDDGASRDDGEGGAEPGSRGPGLQPWAVAAPSPRHLVTSQEACTGLSSFLPEDRLVSCFFASSEAGMRDAKKETLKTKPVSNSAP